MFLTMFEAKRELLDWRANFTRDPNARLCCTFHYKKCRGVLPGKMNPPLHPGDVGKHCRHLPWRIVSRRPQGPRLLVPHNGSATLKVLGHFRENLAHVLQAPTEPFIWAHRCSRQRIRARSLRAENRSGSGLSVGVIDNGSDG